MKVLRMIVGRLQDEYERRVTQKKQSAAQDRRALEHVIAPHLPSLAGLGPVTSAHPIAAGSLQGDLRAAPSPTHAAASDGSSDCWDARTDRAQSMVRN